MSDYTKSMNQDTPPISIPTDSWWPRSDERCSHAITRQFEAKGQLPEIPSGRMHDHIYAEVEFEPETLRDGDTFRCDLTVPI